MLKACDNNLLKFYYRLNKNDCPPLDLPTQILKEAYQSSKSKKNLPLNISLYGKRLLHLISAGHWIVKKSVKRFFAVSAHLFH